MRTLALLGVSASAVAGSPVTEWRQYGGDQNFNRYSALNLINPTNVSKLHVLWRRPALDQSLMQAYPDVVAPKYFASTPIMVDDVLYAPNGVGLVEAFDAESGKTLWVQQPRSAKEIPGRSSRGVAYWEEGTSKRIVVVRGEYLYSLDARTGKSDIEFGDRGRVFLRRRTTDNSHFSVSGAPLVTGNLIIVGGAGGGERGGDYGDQRKSTPESVRAFDIKSGKLVWEFSPLPPEGDPARESWVGDSAKDAGAMGSCGQLSVDERLGYVYVPLSAPNPPVWGGWRPGDNLYGDSLVALDVKTGSKVWAFQMIHHDLWDYDLAAPPVLGDIKVDGRVVHAVMQTGKNALLFTLERATGKPVWPVEERPVPQSNAPGEHSAATQPFPTKPAPLDRVGVTEDDLIDFTPELRQQALKIFAQYSHGRMYSPPTVKTATNRGTLTLPGTDGGGSWNTGAFDPETCTYYALTVTTVSNYSLVKPKAQDATVDFVFEDLPGTFWAPGPQGLPLVKPPYGRISAVDMNQGAIKWAVPNGDGPRNHPLLKSLHLPPLGVPGRAALIVTKSLLFAGESSTAVNLATITGGFGNKFRAYDKVTGKVLAEVDLGAGTTGAPITYGTHGKQIVLVAVSGMNEEPDWVALGL